MTDPVKVRNACLGSTVVQNLEKRGFKAYYCETASAAAELALSLIPKEDVVAWGGSVSVSSSGLLNKVKASYTVIDRDTAANAEERVEMMRKSLLCDTFLMSSNAVSEDGQLVNIDGNGNRCAALIYGPKQVIVLVGINKIVKTVHDAVARARGTAAPINAQRFAGLNTPCQKTGACMDCLSPSCICNQIVITRRCQPQGRIKVIIAGEVLGF